MIPTDTNNSNFTEHLILILISTVMLTHHKDQNVLQYMYTHIAIQVHFSILLFQYNQSHLNILPFFTHLFYIHHLYVESLYLKI